MTFLLQQKLTQSRNSMKWKGLSAVILPCFQRKGQPAPVVMILFESRNSMKWKGLSAVILVLFSKSRSNCPWFNDLFWKLQFNENEKNFQTSFWLCFHTFSESRNSMKMKKTFTVYDRVSFERCSLMIMKRLSTIILYLFSKQKSDYPFRNVFSRGFLCSLERGVRCWGLFFDKSTELENGISLSMYRV